MRGALDWSYELLSDFERRILGRLSVFSNGATLDAIQYVCSSSDTDVRPALENLADKSLLITSDTTDSLRFAMLEVIAAYAAERFADSDDAQHERALRLRHAQFFAELARDAPGGLRGPDQLRWLERLEAEHDNLRAALDWALQEREAALAGQLAAGVWPFWR